MCGSINQPAEVITSSPPSPLSRQANPLSISELGCQHRWSRVFQALFLKGTEVTFRRPDPLSVSVYVQNPACILILRIVSLF